MSNQVYVQIHQLRSLYKNKILPTLQECQDTEPNFRLIQTKWVALAQEGTGIKRYYDIVRELSKLLEVTVLRNPHSTYDGISVVGNAILVDKFIDKLQSIINTIEKQTSTANRPSRSPLHLREYRANLKGKYVAAYLRMISELAALKAIALKEDYWYRDQNLRKEFIKTSPLRHKKVFR